MNKLVLAGLIIVALLILSAFPLNAMQTNTATAPSLSNSAAKFDPLVSDSSLADYSYRIPITGTNLKSTTQVLFSRNSYTNNNLSNEAIMGASCVKPAILNGSRYIFVSYGWGGGQVAAIQCYSADVNWHRVSLLKTTSQTTFSEIYTWVFPSVYNDLIILSGSTGNNFGTTGGFVMAYNITSNAYQGLTNTLNLSTSWITGVYWSFAINKFVLTGITPRMVYFESTSTNLFNCANWVIKQSWDYSATHTGEARLTVQPNSNYAYYSWVNTSSNMGRMWRWDLTNDAITSVFNTTFNANNGNPTAYVNSNSTTVFCTYCNGTNYHYFYSNDGNTWIDFAQLPVTTGGTVDHGSPERHSHIFPVSSNKLIIGTISDGNTASFYNVVDTHGNIYGTYTINSHFTDNIPTQDQNGTALIIGAEGPASQGDYMLYLSIGLQSLCKTDFSDINFAKSDQTTPLNFNAFKIVAGNYAEFAVDTSSIIGKQTFYIYFGKTTQTSLSNSSITPSGTDNAGLQFNAIQTTVKADPVYLLLNVEPQTAFTKGMQLTFRVNVLNQLNPSINSTLTLAVSGPGKYYYFDFQSVNVTADSMGEYSFAWIIPNVSGTYIAEVGLVPSQLTAYDATWLEVT